MNFFGHAALARQRSPSALFAFGAMLPDFSSMIRARAPRCSDPEVGAGVAFHHQTDSAFHQCAAFVELSTQAFAELSALGVAKGPARAVAHVGVELLLDGVMSEDADARRGFYDALEVAPTAFDRLIWRDHGAAERLRILCERLRQFDLVHATPEGVARRLERALATRPRLALDGSDLGRVTQWALGARAQVALRSKELFAQVAAALSREKPVPGGTKKL